MSESGNIVKNVVEYIVTQIVENEDEKILLLFQLCKVCSTQFQSASNAPQNRLIFKVAQMH